MRFFKLVGAFAGIAIIAGSLALAGFGVVLLAATDDGVITAGPIGIHTESAALVADGIDLVVDDRDFGTVAINPANITLEVTSRDGGEIFVGLGPEAAVQTYLDGVDHAAVAVSDHEAIVSRVAGVTTAPAPADQDFWIASSESGTLDWELSNGRYAVAVLNADGSPNVDVTVIGSADVPFLEPIAAGLVVIGIVGTGIGGLVTYLGVRRSPTPPAPPSAAHHSPVEPATV